MRFGDLGPRRTLPLKLSSIVEPTSAGRGAGVVRHDLVPAAGGHLDIPCDPVVSAGPVGEERAVSAFPPRPAAARGRAATPSRLAGSHVIGNLAVADRTRPVVVPEAGQERLFPVVDGPG